MKNSILITIFTLSVFLNGCESNMVERSIGFVAGETQDTKWHLGTQQAIDVVDIVDELWTNQDYESMRQYFADANIVLELVSTGLAPFGVDLYGSQFFFFLKFSI